MISISMTNSPAARLTTSIRTRILGWIMLVVFTALTCVVYLTDAIRRNEIHNQANTAVLQEIDEFRAFIDKSPTPLKNSKEVVEAYLSQEIPHDGEIMVGQINGVVVEQKTERKPGTPQQYQQLLKIVFTSPNNSGITESVHWGRVEMSSPNQKKPDYFVVAVSTADAYNLNEGEVVIWGSHKRDSPFRCVKIVTYCAALKLCRRKIHRGVSPFHLCGNSKVMLVHFGGVSAL